MALNIGDNFKYLGKKFLDDRQSFNTLTELMACTAVPEGFIAYCVEEKRRYEFIDGNWIEYKENSNFDDVIINGDSVFYMGSDEPETNDVLWLDPGVNQSTTDITIDNPLIQELFSCIKELQGQVKELQMQVEYLQINGGGGVIIPPDDDEDLQEEIYLELEDGGLFLLEDGGYIVLEEYVVVPKPEEPEIKVSAILLEDGQYLLAEDGTMILLEN